MKPKLRLLRTRKSWKCSLFCGVIFFWGGGFYSFYCFLGGAVVKNLPTSARDPRDVGSIPGSGRSPGVENDNPFRILAWKVPWTQKAGGLQVMRPQRVRHNWATKHIVFNSLLATVVFFSLIWLLKIQNASQICVPSLHRGHGNLLWIVPILVYVLPKWAAHILKNVKLLRML